MAIANSINRYIEMNNELTFVLEAEERPGGSTSCRLDHPRRPRSGRRQGDATRGGQRVVAESGPEEGIGRSPPAPALLCSARCSTRHHPRTRRPEKPRGATARAVCLAGLGAPSGPRRIRAWGGERVVTADRICVVGECGRAAEAEQLVGPYSASRRRCSARAVAGRRRRRRGRGRLLLLLAPARCGGGARGGAAARGLCGFGPAKATKKEKKGKSKRRETTSKQLLRPFS